ncbi:type VII secretion-associated protein [Gordonia sp. DT30]|uniref:type VII secretion-associated protein n=1 Tax=Gordonia sp. DT30 TaxID=3416546 RepID=UPI003CF91A97
MTFTRSAGGPAVDAGVPARPVVIDIAYGHTMIGGVPGPDLTALLNAIDAEVIVADGVSATAEARWHDVFARICGGGGAPVLIGYPSTWGPVRSGVLARAAGSLHPASTFTPRAILIARSHADVTVTRCAVVETTHVPAHRSDPTDPGPPRWDVQRLRRGGGGWVIEASGVLVPSGDGAADAAAVEALIDDGIEAVYVDGADGGDVGAAISLILEYAVAGRIVAVDRRRIARWGAKAAHPVPLDFGDLDAEFLSPPESSRRGRGARRMLGAAAAVMTVLVVVLAVCAWLSQRGEQAPATDRQVTQGRTTVLIPSGWQRTEQGPVSGAPGPAAQSRAVFVAPDDGSRILLIQSPVRSGSTPSSVAVSLRNRIAQRGDDVVSEFSASTLFAGRDVISYREAPASGAPIRWYVLVEHDLQVSLGCQAGTGGDSVDTPCATAVASVRIAPR